MAEKLLLFAFGLALLTGFAVLAGLVLFGLSAGFCKIQEWALARQEKRFRDRLAVEVESFANRLMNDSWSFSEDEPTMKLLQHIAGRMAKYRELYIYVDAARNAWRDARVVAAGKTEAKEGSGSPI